MTMTTTPPRRMSTLRYSISARPAVVTNSDPSTNTAVNLGTNSSALSIMRPRDRS